MSISLLDTFMTRNVEDYVCERVVHHAKGFDFERGYIIHQFSLASGKMIRAEIPENCEDVLAVLRAQLERLCTG